MKDCLIIGFPTALHYNDVYPLLMDKILTVTEREVPFYVENKHIGAKWFSTLNRAGINMRRRQLTKTYNSNDYQTYDNAPDIIECSNKSNIPVDYHGKIGVPISFFSYYPELDYEILEKRGDLKLNGKRLFTRLIIRRKQL